MFLGVQENAMEYAEEAITRSMLQAMGISVFVYTVTALVLSLLTRNLDFRTSYIVVGLSNFVGSFFCLLDLLFGTSMVGSLLQHVQHGTANSFGS